MTSSNGVDIGITREAGKDVLAALELQAAVYRRLGALAQRQHVLIATEDPQPLLQLLADRQTILDELSEISGRLEPYRTNWTAVRRTLSTEERDVADRLLGEASECLGKILSGDEEDAKLLAARKSRTSAVVSSVQVSRRMLTAYGAGSTGGTRFDRTDEG